MFLVKDYLLLATPVVFFCIFKYCTRNKDYWRKRNVPGLPATPLIGNLWGLLSIKHNLGTILEKFYKYTEAPYVGFFTFDEPALLVRDPELVKNILMKDFKNFQDRVIQAPSHNDTFRNFLFVQKNPEWKSSRLKLTPLFSSGNLKPMCQVIQEVCGQLVQFIETNDGVHETKDLAQRFATETITRTFLGIDGHCLDKKESDILANTQALFEYSVRNALKRIEVFFRSVIFKRMKDLEAKEDSSKNYISFLDNSQPNDPMFDGNKIVGVGLTLFGAGTETTAATISFTLYALCMHAEIQEKVRSEVTNVIAKHGISYESLKEMSYLGMCISETLRRYAPMPFLDRKCTTDYKIPGSDLVLEKGLSIYISVSGIQNDEKYFPEPEKFIPERHENKMNTDKLIFTPFGYGPRICIGERLGLLNTKLALVYILMNYFILPATGTPASINYDPKSFFPNAKGGLPLKFVKINT